MQPNILSRLDTDTTFIKNLIVEINKGEIKIPQFQRRFVWKEKQALDLLDSISNNYPIGSLLLWRTVTKLATDRNIGDFRLPDTDDITPTNYVLDGQQRITVIYSCTGAPDTAEGFAVGYDLDNDRFIPLPQAHDPKIFPLRWMYDTTKMLDFRTGLRVFPNKDEYQSKLDTLIAAFTNYKIPVVTLKDLSLEEVCPIFERINSSGTKLSMYDLMVAATWSNTFDLNQEVNKISTSLKPKGFGNIDPNTVLKCLAAVYKGSIKKNDILSLRDISEEDMDSIVSKTRDALLKSIDLLTTEFGIYSWAFLPYEAILVILCFIFANSDHLTGEKIVRIRQWFWRSAFSERYRVGGENFVSDDLSYIRKYVIDEVDEPISIGSIPTDTAIVATNFRIANSRARAFILALAMKKPRNLTNGSAIDTTEALSSFNKKQFHHIHPRAHLRRTNAKGEHNSIVNICMLSASENNRISDKRPNVYLPDCIINLGESADRVLESNLMPRSSDFDYTNPSYEDFMAIRSIIVTSYIDKLCSGHAQ